MKMSCLADLPNLPIAKGVSEHSLAIGRVERKAKEDRDRSLSFGWRRMLRDTIIELAEEGSVPGWDGYGAHPISWSSCRAAIHFIELLPDHVLAPEAVPEPSGEIGLEWNRGKDMIFSMSISPRRIVFAGIFGASKRNGEERFIESIPEAVLEILSQYFSAA